MSNLDSKRFLGFYYYGVLLCCGGCRVYSGDLHVYLSADGLCAESVRARYTVWVAQYNVRCTYDGNYGIWQYSSKGSVPGVRGCVDMNICYEDFGAEESAEVKEPRKTVDELAREVIAGKWGNGSKRKRLLAEAGYDYAKVQERDNRILM